MLSLASFGRRQTGAALIRLAPRINSAWKTIALFAKRLDARIWDVVIETHKLGRTAGARMLLHIK